MTDGELSVDVPSNSNEIPAPVGAVNTETAPHTEENIPSITADVKALEKDARAAIVEGIKNGLRQLGRLPDWLAHEIEKLADYVETEVKKL